MSGQDQKFEDKGGLDDSNSLTDRHSIRYTVASDWSTVPNHHICGGVAEAAVGVAVGGGEVDAVPETIAAYEGRWCGWQIERGLGDRIQRRCRRQTFTNRYLSKDQ